MGLGLALVLAKILWHEADDRSPQDNFFVKWFFAPGCWLPVFVVSCLIDFARGQPSLRRWQVRFPLEIFLGIPLWSVLWMVICRVLDLFPEVTGL